MVHDPITREGLRSGAVEIVPGALATFAFGLAFGVYAAQHGLTFGLALFMNTAMAAGTAQFAAVALWHEPLPWLAMIAASVAVNLRFTLMSATLRPYWGGVPAWRAYLSFFFLYDSNWAQLMRRHVDGRGENGYLLSSGAFMFVLWEIGMIGGYQLGVMVAEPGRFGIDFILPAFLATTTASLWRRRSDYLPLVVAALVAVLCRRYVSVEVYILAGALAGSLAVLVRRPREDGNAA